MSDLKFVCANLLFVSFSYTLAFINAHSNDSKTEWGLLLYLIISNLGALCRASLTEPAFLPVRAEPEPEETTVYISATGTNIVSQIVNDVRILKIDGLEYRQKWCYSCNVFRPEGSSHCANCNRCVQERDHHCLWLDNCIGRNNHTFFFYFVYTLLFIQVYNGWVYKWKIAMATSILFGVFSLYHTLLWIFDVKSRDFLNSGGKCMNKKIDCEVLVRKMTVIKPCVYGRDMFSV